MSNPSIKSPASPVRQSFVTDHKDGGGTKDHAFAGDQAEQELPYKAATNSGGGIERVTAPPMDYPIDENLFYSAPSQPLPASATDDVVNAANTADEHPQIDELEHSPDFRSFFTLIEEPETGEHHHPIVHYIFSDDDPEILTSAALEALDKDGDDGNSTAQQDEVEERYVVVDMAADGKSVISAASMSADWQSLKTSISQAPSWSHDSKGTDNGLMMKIVGQESGANVASRYTQKRHQQSANLEDLIQAFGERLESLGDALGRAEGADLEQETK